MAQGVIHHIGGSSEKLNLFAQSTEPSKKDGIWIKIDGKDGGQFTQNPSINSNHLNSSIASIGTDIYIFGGSASVTSAHKYDTLLKTYTILANIPINFREGSCVAVGTDIYLFGSAVTVSQKKAYKYDTLTNTYTELADIPYNFYNGQVQENFDTIYLFGSQNSDYAKNVYKYDIDTNTYSQLTSLPYNFYFGASTKQGYLIFLLGGGATGGTQFNYCFNTIKEEFTRLTDVPYEFTSGSSILMKNKIYLLGGTNSARYFYQYDFIKNKYTQLNDLPIDFYKSSATTIDSTGYLLGGSSGNAKYNYKVEIVKTDELNKFDYKNVELSECINEIEILPKELTSADHTFVRSTAVIENDVYLAVTGSHEGGSKTQIYKYSSTADQFIKATTMPIYWDNGVLTTIGTDIYFLGNEYNSANYKDNYKWDTLTNTFTKLTSIPSSFYGGAAVTIGTDIYLFADTNAYKYNTLTGTYTILTSVPTRNYWRATRIENDIYLCSSGRMVSSASGGVIAYKYNILNAEYTVINSLDTIAGFMFVAVGSNIYFSSAREYIDGDSTNPIPPILRKYDTIRNRTHELARLPEIPCNGIAKIGNYIYFLGKSTPEAQTPLICFKFLVTNIENDDIVITTQMKNQTMLTKNLKLNFSNAYVVEGGIPQQQYPAYYGTGEEWVKINNEEEI